MARSGFGTIIPDPGKPKKFRIRPVPDPQHCLHWIIFQAYEGYESLTADPNVDIVYIGGINPLHHKVAKMALNAGKEGGL